MLFVPFFLKQFFHVNFFSGMSSPLFFQNVLFIFFSSLSISLFLLIVVFFLTSFTLIRCRFNFALGNCVVLKKVVRRKRSSIGARIPPRAATHCRRRSRSGTDGDNADFLAGRIIGFFYLFLFLSGIACITEPLEWIGFLFFPFSSSLLFSLYPFLVSIFSSPLLP